MHSDDLLFHIARSRDGIWDVDTDHRHRFSSVDTDHVYAVVIDAFDPLIEVQIVKQTLYVVRVVRSTREQRIPEPKAKAGSIEEAQRRMIALLINNDIKQ